MQSPLSLKTFRPPHCGGRVVRYDLAGDQPVEQHLHLCIRISWDRPKKLATDDHPIVDKSGAFCA